MSTDNVNHPFGDFLFSPLSGWLDYGLRRRGWLETQEADDWIWQGLDEAAKQIHDVGSDQGGIWARRTASALSSSLKARIIDGRQKRGDRYFGEVSQLRAV